MSDIDYNILETNNEQINSVKITIIKFININILIIMYKSSDNILGNTFVVYSITNLLIVKRRICEFFDRSMMFVSNASNFFKPSSKSNVDDPSDVSIC